MIRAVALLAWLVLWCTNVRATDESMRAFAQLPLIENPRLSPDGTRFACLIAGQGRQLLAVMKLPQWQPVTVQIAETDELLDWQWVNDEWLVITIGSLESMQGDLWRITRAYGVRANDAKVVPLGRKGDAQNTNILWTARDGTPRILLAVQQSVYADQEKYYPEVFEVDVSTGKRGSRVRPRMGVMAWFADSDGVVRMGIGHRELSRTSQVLYREGKSDAFTIIDSANARKGESLDPVPAMFKAQPGKALAYSDHTGFTALHELDLATQTLGEEVFSVPGYDIGDLITDPSGKELLGVRYTDTYPRTRWLEPVMSKVQRDLDQAFGPDRRAEIVSMNRNQDKLIVFAGTASDPGRYYLLDLQRRQLDEISSIRPSLKDIALAPVRSVRYRARDGLEIEAVLTLPAAREPRDLPLIVLPHGGPYSRDDESFDWWAQYLAHLGYAVIQPNYRGSSGYGSEFAARGDGQWGLAMQDDLLDAVQYLASAGMADPRRVCILGGSYGGYAAMRAAQRDSASLRCAISFAGVSDMTAMVNYDADSLNGRWVRDLQKRRSPDLDAVSPIHGVQQFGIPVLLLHGKKDLVVPHTQSEMIAGKLARAGKQVRHVELPQGDHHLSRTEDRLRFLQEITTFLNEHNRADTSGEAAP